MIQPSDHDEGEASLGGDESGVASSVAIQKQPAKKEGDRPKKKATTSDQREGASLQVESAVDPVAIQKQPAKKKLGRTAKKKRGRPKKKATTTSDHHTGASLQVESAVGPAEIQKRPAKKRGRPKKKATTSDQHEEASLQVESAVDPVEIEKQPAKKKTKREATMPAWEVMFYQLVVYKTQNGNCNVPKEKSGQLGRWVHLQIENKDNLTQDQRAVLTEIGFSFHFSSRWYAHYAELEEFRAKHGHVDVKWKEGTLGQWVATQRKRWQVTLKVEAGVNISANKINELPLPLELKAKLDELGFKWTVYKKTISWDGRIEQLKAYRERFGDCSVPTHWPEDPGLGGWCGKQRLLYKQRLRGAKNPLTDKRIEDLQSVGFVWSRGSARQAPKETKEAAATKVAAAETTLQTPQLFHV